MAGCAKADKKRKSPQNVAYKTMKKAEVNKAKRVAKHKEAMAQAKEKNMIVPKGSTRNARRHPVVQTQEQEK